ncbi:MAG TPA: NEAT domain-containing protein [Lactobacillaceae bacterium]|jgi:hypothetical protein
MNFVTKSQHILLAGTILLGLATPAVGSVFADTTSTTTTTASATTGTQADYLAANKNVTLADGTYLIPIHNYKTGTTTSSSMDKTLASYAKVVVANGQATVSITVTNASTFNMMAAYRLDTQSTSNAAADVQALLYSDMTGDDTTSWVKNTADATADTPNLTFTQTVPLADLSGVLSTAMHIPAAGQYGWNTADMVFDLANAQKSESYSFYQSGTTTLSSMDSMFTKAAYVPTSDVTDAVVLTMTDANLAAALKSFTLTDKDGKVYDGTQDGVNWTFNLPHSVLNQNLVASVEVSTPNYSENQKADLRFDNLVEKHTLTVKYFADSDTKGLYTVTTKAIPAVLGETLQIPALAGYDDVDARGTVQITGDNTVGLEVKRHAYKITYTYVNTKTAKQMKTSSATVLFGQNAYKGISVPAGYTAATTKSVIGVDQSGQLLTSSYKVPLTPKTYTTTYKYIDSRTGKTIKTVKKTYYTGQTTTKYQPAITGYTTPKAAKLTAPAKNQTLKIKYTPKKYTITYKYVNVKNHKALAKNKVVKNVAYNSTQKPKAITIKGYKAKSVKAFTVKKSQTYTIYYTKK